MGKAMKSVVVSIALACATIEIAHPEVVDMTRNVAGTTVGFKVVLPDGYDPNTEYPGVLVFGGGPQTMRTVTGTLDRNFRDEAERRGYIVVAPAASDGKLFFRDGALIFPEFLDMLLSDYRIRHRKFHVAGPSNGGIAALHVAARNPQYFLSATAFPGYLWEPTAAKLRALAPLCVFLYVGENDEYRWHGEMEREVEALRAGGTLAVYSLEAGQGHRLESVAGSGAGRLFDGFEQAETGCRL